jgi:GDPmannose 4,6-dehydratase
MTKRAFITGITGQDGSYLTELLLDKGYEVHGLVRRLSVPNYNNIEHLLKDINLIDGDLGDQSSVMRAIKIAEPDEVYNLAAQSFVATSWSQPELTADITGLGCIRVLEALRVICPDAKFYQASSSEMFGAVVETPQSEKTPFHPRSPYGVSKVMAYWATVNYRESYDMKTFNGILFNHESPRRGIEFVTRKITDMIARIHLGMEKKLMLGNMDVRRDWGFAGDYVEVMWRMLQLDEGDDFVVGTGENHSVKEFVDEAFKVIGIDDWEDHVEVDKRYYRPAEVYELRADPSKAKKVLGWEPKVSFKELVEMMVRSDLERLKG